MSEEERAKMRRFYEELGEICKLFGFEVYLPHIYGDPKFVAHLAPKQIDRIDRLAVTQSYLVVACVGISSTGVGIEIELAYHANKPVILLYEQKKLNERRISRLVRGNPAVVSHIVYESFDDAKVKLDAFLKEFCRSIVAENALPPLLSL